MTEVTGRLQYARSRYFVSGAFRRFFIPALTSSFWLAVAGVADSAFVGVAVGSAGLAAISFGQPVYLFYNILSYGFSIGGSIHYAARMAEGREEEGSRIFLTVLKLLLVTYIATAALGIAFLPQLMALLGADPADSVTYTYIRTQLIFVPIMFCQGPFYYFVNADNGPKRAAAAMSVSGLSDAVFSYIFVSRMGLGVAGSVYSTVVGAVLMLCISGWHIAAKKGALRFRREKMDWSAIGISARTGFATSLRYLFEFITMIAVNRMLMRMSGSVAVAAFDVVFNISLLSASISDGAAVAIEPMLSSYRSERNLENIRITLQLALKWAGLYSLGFAVVLAALAPQASVVFGMRSGLEIEYTSMGIRLFTLSIIPAMINTVFGGYYQSIQRETYSYFITFLRSLVFYLIALAFCGRGGMGTFWYVFVMAEALSIVVWMPVSALRGGILQLRSIDASRARSVVIDRSSQDLAAEVEKVQEFCSQSVDDARLIMYIGLTVEEICLAITEHFADRMDDIYIQITVVVDEGECTLYIRDNALEFNPLGSNTGEIDLDAEKCLDLVGVRIIQQKAKEFYYRHYSGFNTLVIRL